jgi:hypothetical protein
MRNATASDFGTIIALIGGKQPEFTQCNSSTVFQPAILRANSHMYFLSSVLPREAPIPPKVIGIRGKSGNSRHLRDEYINEPFSKSRDDENLGSNLIVRGLRSVRLLCGSHSSESCRLAQFTRVLCSLRMSEAENEKIYSSRMVIIAIGEGNRGTSWSQSQLD